MKKLRYCFDLTTLGLSILLLAQVAMSQTATRKEPAPKEQISVPEDPRELGEQKYQELKAKGLLPEPPQVQYTKDNEKQRTIHKAGTRGATPQFLIPRDVSFTAISRCDDCSEGPLTLPFSFNFYGTCYNELFINTNGNITFGSGSGTYTPSGFPAAGLPRVAPFWADVETDPIASGQVWYKIESNRITVIWDGVGYYASHTDKLNTFEAILTDGTDAVIGVGNNVAFSYGDMQWTTGDASGGVGGFGGTPATVGINRGNGVDFALVGRFDHAGTDYDGPGGANDGVSYLDNKDFFFSVGGGVGTARISGRKFLDIVNFGVDDGEAGIPGWTITATGPVTRSVVTDAQGNYTIPNLPCGVYTVSETQQAGFVQTFPAFGVYVLSIGPGDNVTDINFGNRFFTTAGRGSISGVVFEDINGNGIRDSGEPPISGRQIDITARGFRRSTLSAPDGTYRFINLSPSTYTVQQFLPSSSTQTLPTGGQPYVIPLTSGAVRAGADFGSVPPVRPSILAGIAFDDRDGNGKMDPGEQGIAGRRIELNGPVSSSTLTDAAGAYVFTELPGGTYTLRQVLPVGAVQTTPPAGQAYEIILAAGDQQRDLNFGSRIVTSAEEITQQPNEYALYQNFPNPFNPTTQISFYLPKDSYITLRVYNVLGIEVATLVEGRVSSGTHSVSWNAQDVPSGIYVYKLDAGSFVATRKMVLMK